MAPVETPVVGDTVMFLRAAFQVYDDFPDGSPVGPEVAFVDCLQLFVVEDVRETLLAMPRQRGGRRRRRGPLQDELVVAVRLQSANGTMLWTIFSKGEHHRMEVVDPSMRLV